MKCPQCGFRNLSGAKICGACGSDLTIQTINPPESFYPPRAWGRRFRQFQRRADEARIGWQTRYPSPTETLLQDIERRRTIRLIWLTALRSLLGIIPGLGLLKERQTRNGWRLFLAFLSCVAITFLCWRNFLSNIALLAIFLLSIYSVGATFFAAWRRNNLPTLETFQKVGVWLTIVSLFIWAYVAFRSALNIVGGTAFMPVGFPDDPVTQAGNQVLYSRLRQHLTNLSPGDYVVVDTSNARLVQWAGYGFVTPYDIDVQIRFSPLTLGRVEAILENPNGTELEVSVPLVMFDGRLQRIRVIVPIEAVQGKIVAILNPPSRRRWLP